MADTLEAKEQPQKERVTEINKVEDELKELKKQLHKIEEQIRDKSVELSTIMARSVSLTDIDEILGLDRNISDTSSLSMDLSNIERKESNTETENDNIVEVSPSPTSSSTTSNNNNNTPKSKTRKSIKKKKKKKGTDKKRQATQIWKELENKIRDGKINYVKKLIQLNKIKINDNTQYNGRTILMMSAEHGQYDICKMLINLGADVTMTTKYKDDTRDAIHFSNKMGHYHISRLLLISSFGGESSNKINDIIDKMRKQQAINEDFIKTMNNNDNKNEEKTNDNKWIESMTEYICGLIKNRKAFSDDMLSTCWSYILYKDKSNALNSNLWKTIMKSCIEVIQSKDANNWYWLTQYMLKSTIWLQNDPGKESKDYEEDITLQKLLLQQLFDVTNKQSEKNSEKLKKMEEKFNADFKSLIAFDVETKYGESPRQDLIPNGLIAKYSKEELSQNINPSNTFNALQHYDMVSL